MKNSAYIKTIYATILFVMLLLCSTFANAQSQMKARMVKQETCDVTHDGQATIDLPDGASNYIVKWTYPDGQTSSAQTISGLEHGIYTVKVRANLCPDKVIYSDFVNVTQKGDCSVNVSISVSTASVPCDVQPTATLTASASGGKPPYSFSWRTKQVSSSGSYSCTVTDSDGNTGTGVTSVYLKEQECSQDPNEISGPDGYGDKMMVNTVDKMSYTINFENDPDFATAPASRVTVNYPVPAQHKISSYRMSDFGFGDFVFTVPNNTTSYYKRLDVSDSLGVWVDVTAGIDIVNNELFWIFQSIDPATGFEPQSAQMGFLPVNDSLERGIGYVNFFINPADGLQTKDTVVAMASIVFDDNSPIATNYWTNEFNAVAPTSTIVDVITLPSDTLNCNVVFSSQDDLDGSGVNSIELFVSTNETAYISAGTFNPSDTGNFSLEAGAYYRFISIATDNVGNVETFKTAPDFIIDYNTAPTDILLSNNYFYENDAIGTLVGLFTTIDNDVNYTFNYQFVDGDGSEDNAKFTINNNQLNTNFNFNCYGQQYYYIRVRSVDVTGLYFDKEFELTMNFTNSSYNLHFSDEICQRETYNSLGWTIQTTDSVPGVYTYVNNLQTTLGCDSIRTLTLTIKPVYSSYDNINICSSQLPYTYGDTIFPVGTLSGIYPVIFSSDNSCDSTVNLELIVYDNDSYEETAGVCDNEQPYVWHNHNVDINVLPVGTYVFWDSLTTVNGCDSIYKLTLTVNPTYAVTDNITICQSELPYYYAPADTTFQVGTQALSIIDYPLSTIHGCDSTVTLHLTVNPTYAITDNVTICQSELPYYYAPADTTFQVGTPALSIVHYPLSTIHGCDSIITLQLTVNPTYAITDNVTICQSELPYYYAPADTTFQVGTPPLSIIHYPLSTI
ncbi:MAG: hypothetical protein PHY65_09845, partial [Bacteroidales bacterium]|nr:hypothetical protein [Bacteroidales bacterium]